MAVRQRAAQSIGGPDGQSSWSEFSFETTIAGFSATVAQQTVPLWVVPSASPNLAGSPNPDGVASGQAIGSLSAVSVAFGAALAAQAALLFEIGLYRAGALVGVAAFGYASNTPAFSALTPVTLPALGSGSPFVAGSSGSYIPLRPNDVIALITSGVALALPTFTLTGAQ